MADRSSIYLPHENARVRVGSRVMYNNAVLVEIERIIDPVVYVRRVHDGISYAIPVRGLGRLALVPPNQQEPSELDRLKETVAAQEAQIKRLNQRIQTARRHLENGLYNL